MGCRSCEKQKMNYRKGLWSPEEDHRLREYVLKHGHGCWTTVPAKAGLQRTGKSCRLRWLNYLRPGLKHGIFSEEEEEMVMKLHTKLGNKWSQIATYLPGRTDNEVKNYWNSYIKKKVNRNFATSSNFTGSDNEVLEANQFPQKTNNQIPASQSFFVSSSSQSTSPSVNEGPSNTKGSNHAASLPKVIFADWLSCSNYMGDEANCQWASDSQKSEQGLLPVNKQANGEFLDGFMDNNIYGELQSQFQIEGQLQGSGLFDLLSVGEICGDLDVNHDMTF